MENIVIVAVILSILIAAIAYIIKEKKKGTVCIGCPHAGTCGNSKSTETGCGCH